MARKTPPLFLRVKPTHFLRGAKTVLRPVEAGDLHFLQTLRNDVALQMQLMAQPRPNPLPRVRGWLARFAANPDAVLLLIAAARGGRPLGFVQLAALDPLHGTADLGICLAEAARGRGHAAEALQLLENYASDVFHLRKLLLRVLAENTRAIALYHAAGYRTVGVLQRHFYQRQAFKDVVLMEKFLAGAATPNP